MVKTQGLQRPFLIFFIFSAFADAAVDPIDFPIAPAYAVPKVRIKLSGFWKKNVSLAFHCWFIPSQWVFLN